LPIYVKLRIKQEMQKHMNTEITFVHPASSQETESFGIIVENRFVGKRFRADYR